MIVDQLTKVWAIGSLQPNVPRDLLGRFFSFTLVFNQGGALGTSFGSPTYYLISGTLILLFLFYYIYYHRHHLVYSYPLSLVAGGAIGNLIDRFRFGHVIDFIDVDFFDIDIFGYRIERWWTFNIADAAISCSIVFLIVFTLFFHKKETTPSA